VGFSGFFASVAACSGAVDGLPAVSGFAAAAGWTGFGNAAFEVCDAGSGTAGFDAAFDAVRAAADAEDALAGDLSAAFGFAAAFLVDARDCADDDTACAGFSGVPFDVCDAVLLPDSGFSAFATPFPLPILTHGSDHSLNLTRQR
tara:strand:+ start:5118 stop:5552 length:435 start_codon:yes stop_codon:yes gene_type:complete